MMSILYLLPKNALSRLVGCFVHWPLPGPLRLWSLRWFAARYQIDLQEAEKALHEYSSIGAFFIRRLKAGARPIAQDAVLVHPADAVISQIGPIAEGQLVQAKGKNYPVGELIKDEKAGAQLRGGLFATYYLCPTDYHRVHSPASGEVVAVRHVPGKLWPVNDWSVSRIDELFCVNERVIVDIKTTEGALLHVVFVGATNVGKVSLSFDPRVSSNLAGVRSLRTWNYNPGQRLEKGEELGMFHMGSTIVLCLPPALATKKTSEQWQKFRQSKSKVGGLLC